MKKLTPIEKLVRAEENFLLSSGWKEIPRKGSKSYWTPLQRIGYVFPGDQVFRSTAIETTKSQLDFPTD